MDFEWDLLAASQLSIGVIVLISLLAFFLAVWGTPIARNAAIHFGIVDKPDGRLKTHRAPTPYMGGIAVFLAVLISLLFVFDFEPTLLGLLLAGELVLLVGLIDDLGALSPRIKFIGQLLAVWILIKAGVRTELGYLPLWVNILITAFWLVAVMNAVNIIDIMDGLASSVVASASAVLVVVALLNELPLIAAASAALLGASCGFLVHNKPPATIYLGDAGSMFMGLMLGGLTMVVRYSEENELAVLSPLLILAVPLFDTGFVSLIRMYRGDSPFRGSPDHYALRLRKLGWTDNQIILASSATGLAFGFITLVNMGLGIWESLSLYVVIGALMLGVALYLGRVRMP